MSSIEPDVALPSDVGKGSDRKRAFTFGLVILLATGALGAWQIHRGHVTRGWVFLGVGAATFAYSLIHPSGALVLRRAWLWIGGFLGRVNGVVLLSVAYVLVLTPLSVVVRLVGRRSFKPPKGTSYFTTRQEQRDAKHFEHPY